ncbi:PRAME family member 18-like isoform X4 [Rattus norvegicus]|uniref:PRAME family member 18-like isoform X4 n=1 Tax=Rattus norvegicus TaxID=10116 RepID=UPI002FD7CC67
MSIPTPLTLQMLARQSLLRNEDVAISSLEEMPNVLFPALFKEAFEGRQTKLVKETVATWPLPCLPVGALMNTQSLETFQAVLDGVDMRLTRKFHPRRTKLQVLDLRNAHHAFWNIWAGAEESSCSAENWEEKQVVKVPDDSLGDSFNHILPNFTERLGFPIPQSKPFSAQTSGFERSGLM